MEEFLHLSQGQRTVDQYAAKFNELLPFSGYLADSEEKRTQRFYRGLRISLKVATAALTIEPLETVVKMAQRIEAIEKESAAGNSKGGSAGRGGGYRPGRRGGSSGGRTQQRYQPYSKGGQS